MFPEVPPSSPQAKVEELEAKKRAKREANRRSAQLSRARKKAFIEDLKQQNQDYQRCEHILACHPDMIFSFDAAGSIDFANRAAARKLGVAEPDSLEQTSFFDILSDESRLRFQSALQQIMSRSGQTQAAIAFDAPLQLLTRDGASLSLDVVGQCTRDEREPGEWTIVCAARPTLDLDDDDGSSSGRPPVISSEESGHGKNNGDEDRRVVPVDRDGDAKEQREAARATTSASFSLAASSSASSSSSSSSENRAAPPPSSSVS